MKSTKAIYRVLDANYNRLREALRVCEDVSRFVITSNALAQTYKRLRHRVTALVLKMPLAYRGVVASRDSENDCGRTSFLRGRKQGSVADVFLRNIKRAEEATRVIEEFTKLIDERLAFEFQKVRFSVYDLEKKTIAKL
jgi:thiamine-phosphate pyrophosphorylase